MHRTMRCQESALRAPVSIGAIANPITTALHGAPKPTLNWMTTTHLAMQRPKP